MAKKSLRALGKTAYSNRSEEARYLYATYRLKFEDIKEEKIMEELGIDKFSEIRLFLEKLQSFSWARAFINKSETEKLSIQEAFPSFFIENLIHVMSLEFLKKNMQYMNQQQRKGILFVRSAPQTNIEQFFKHNNIDYNIDKNLLGLYSVPTQKKRSIIESYSFKRGDITFQDKSSVSVVKVLDPKPNELICDMCAAPGMKTALIAQNSKYLSKIIAIDFSSRRIKQSKTLLKRQFSADINLITTDGIKTPFRFEKKFDKILLDAPCTGSGALGPHPELKWRQSNKFLHQNSLIQKKLLKNALTLLKKEGIIVYSTCSLYPEEGEYQIKHILDQVTPLELPSWISPSYEIEGESLPGSGRLFPAIHHSQGFFIGKFRKKS